jgi:hypothetical protein
MLTVVAKHEATASGILWKCQCDCGGISYRVTINLKTTKNPGCPDCESFRRGMAHVTHGGALGGKSRLYSVWKSMRSRCADKDNPQYGGKGITVCADWDNFHNFRRWSTAHGYAPGLSIDRIDPAKGYSPRNCEWVTRDENSRRVRRPKIQLLLAEALLAA